MKKIIALTLAVLMLLPLFSSLALAIELPEGTPVANVASEAEISVFDTNNMGMDVDSSVDLSRIIDGDKSTGTASPQGMMYSYYLDYSEVRYFTSIVVACNGKGALKDTSITRDTFNVYQLLIRVYDGDNVTYQSEVTRVSELKELTVEPNAKGDRVEVLKVQGTGDRNEYMWEIETYAPDMELCDAKLTNVAAEATFSATGANNNNFWAIRYEALTDGNPLTGTHSPQGRNYSIWMHYSQEYLFSEINIVCNTDGGAVLLGTGAKLEERTYNNQMLRVVVYNYNEDVVWDSDLVDTSTITTLQVEPYVQGAIIEIKVYNGNFGGGEYFYEVSAMAQSGDHIFTPGAEENPTCMLPGYREYNCHCGKVMKSPIPATGFHKWGEGEVTKGASDTENGVLTIPCSGCDQVLLRDIPAIGHNWGNEEVVAPKCGVEGYTLHKCTGCSIEGCTASYKTDYKDALVHNWSEGVVTQKPQVGVKGVTTYTCLVPGCGETYTTPIRAHKYTDSTTKLTNGDVTGITQTLTTEFTAADTKPENIFDGDNKTWWYGPAGSYVDIKLSKEFIFTGGKLVASSNWTDMKIEFYALNPDYDASKPASDENSVYILSATHAQNDIDNGANSNKPLEFDLMATLSSGVRACLVRIISIEAKWGNGSATKMHEVSFDVHKCELTEDDYILEGDDYLAPKCGVDGSCMAVCQVCGVKQQTTIKATANNSHEFTSVTADQNPTCSEAGVGHAVCTKCSQTISGIIIPATKEHDYKVDKVLISAKCGFAGVRQLHCTYCDKVGAKFEIAPTGIHEYEWSTRSYASYTADGITAYACKHCDELDPNTEENTIVAEMLAIPEDILTFVSATKGDGSLTFTYKLKVDYFAEIQETCDIRVITTITDEQGRSASIESYGKYATNSYNEKTGEFSITIHPKNTSDEFEVNTVIRLMNFRGIVYKSCPNGSYEGTISMDDVQ